MNVQVEEKDVGLAKPINGQVAVALLSGGLDSSTAFAMALHEGYTVLPVTFNYEQRHQIEVGYARSLVSHYAHIFPEQVIALKEVSIHGLGYRTSALTNPKMEVPRQRSEAKMAEDIPVTYVPSRNSLFLSVAFGFAEAAAARSVWVGFNAVDYSGYPDCRPEYIRAMQKALNLGSKQGVEALMSGNAPGIAIEAPLVHLPKTDIIKRGRGLEHPVPYELTWSCYVGGPSPCGSCDSCIIRRNAFAALGVRDPLLSSEK